MCHWLHDITLSSNGTFKEKLDTLNDPTVIITSKDHLLSSRITFTDTLIKEQSPCPSVLSDQTKPEGFSQSLKSDPTKHKGKGIVPIITHNDIPDQNFHM